MKNKKVLALLVTATLSLSLLTGCQGDKPASTDTPSSAQTQEAQESTQAQETQPAPEEQADSEDLMDTEMYNAYIDANNLMVDSFYDVLETYFNYVAFQEEFELSDPEYWCSYYTENDKKILKTAYDLAQAREPKEAVDNAYITLYPVMEKLMDAVNEVEQYTELKSYVDDDYAKGKELHAVIWNAYNEFEPLSDTFTEALRVISDEQEAKDLAQMKEEGYEITYTMNILLSQAQDIQTEIYAQDIYDDNVVDLDLEKIQPLYDEFVATVDTLMGYFNDKEMLAQEGFTEGGVDTYHFKSKVEEIKVALTDLVQRVKDNEPLTDFELDSSMPADGSVSNYDDKVSELIDSYNDMF